jgi:hypothetical protein
MIIPLLVGALGNREWGRHGGSRFTAVAMISLAAFIANKELLFWFPLIYTLIFLFRTPATGPTWLAASRGENIRGAILRGWLALPYGAAITSIDGKPYHFFIAMFFPVCGLFYLAMGKIWKSHSTELAELLVGAYLVSIAGVY